MIKVNKNKIIKEFNLTLFGQKGWMSNKNIECPECGKKNKFGFKFLDKNGIVHCFYCDYKTSLSKYLFKIKRTDLLSSKIEISVNNTLRKISENEQEEEINELKEVKLPLKLKRINNDEYLNKRNFLKEHYEEFEPCYTTSILEPKLKDDYILFKIKQNKKVVAWIARSRKSYGWHKKNLENYKKGVENLRLRYINSSDVEFGNILGGHDDIKDNTETVILVEGMFDKINIDNKLDLFNQEELVCCFTFGNKISDNQIKLLRKKTNIKNVILFYDYGTVKISKGYSLKLNKYFNTYVTVSHDKNKDAGDMSKKEIIFNLNNIKSVMDFYINQLNTSLNGTL